MKFPTRSFRYFARIFGSLEIPSKILKKKFNNFEVGTFSRNFGKHSEEVLEKISVNVKNFTKFYTIIF